MYFFSVGFLNVSNSLLARSCLEIMSLKSATPASERVPISNLTAIPTPEAAPSTPEHFT